MVFINFKLLPLRRRFRKKAQSQTPVFIPCCIWDVCACVNEYVNVWSCAGVIQQLETDDEAVDFRFCSAGVAQQGDKMTTTERLRKVRVIGKQNCSFRCQRKRRAGRKFLRGGKYCQSVKKKKSERFGLISTAPLFLFSRVRFFSLDQKVLFLIVFFIKAYASASIILLTLRTATVNQTGKKCYECFICLISSMKVLQWSQTCQV